MWEKTTDYLRRCLNGYYIHGYYKDLCMECIHQLKERVQYKLYSTDTQYKYQDPRQGPCHGSGFHRLDHCYTVHELFINKDNQTTINETKMLMKPLAINTEISMMKPNG